MIFLSYSRQLKYLLSYFSAILKVLVDFGISSDDESLIHTANLMNVLGKASNFDMTLMFMDTKEKKDLVSIV